MLSKIFKYEQTKDNFLLQANLLWFVKLILTVDTLIFVSFGLGTLLFVQTNSLKCDR